MLTFKIEDEDNQRLDIYLCSKLPSLSRAFIQKLLKQDRILVNNEPAKPGYKTRLTDTIVINYDLSESIQIPEISLPIIYEDKDCLVINKPVGVLSHARDSFSAEATVASFIRDHVSDIEGDRAGIVHRLDRFTSGVMICAKNSSSLSWFQKQFSSRKVQKTYIAIVTGQLKIPEAIIDIPIGRNPKLPSRFRVDSNGKTASTHYKVIATSTHYSVIELHPKTGRTHQLRVHLAHTGHPIVGDVLYGGKAADRLYLHALSLDIAMPSQERMLFEVPLPSDFSNLIDSDD